MTTGGSAKPDGSFARKPPRGPGEAAVEVILRQLRPNATGFRVVDSARLHDVEEKVRAVHEAQLRMMDSSWFNRCGRTAAPCSPMLRPGSSPNARGSAGGRQRVGRGSALHDARHAAHGSVTSNDIRSENGYWLLSDVRTARAPAGQLEDRVPTLLMLAGSLRETPRWSAALSELKLRLAEAKTRSMRIRFEEIRKRGEILANCARRTVRHPDEDLARSAGVEQDRVHKATIDSIRGARDFRAADGEVHTVTNLYDRAFVNPNGNIIITNDPNLPSAGGRLGEPRHLGRDAAHRSVPARGALIAGAGAHPPSHARSAAGVFLDVLASRTALAQGLPRARPRDWARVRTAEPGPTSPCIGASRASRTSRSSRLRTCAARARSWWTADPAASAAHNLFSPSRRRRAPRRRGRRFRTRGCGVRDDSPASREDRRTRPVRVG